MTEPAVIPPARKRGLLWVGIALLLVFIVVGVTLASRFGLDPTLVASPLIGKPVPDATLPYLDQPGDLALRDLKGDIVVVNFWASWCFPCRREHGVLLKGAADYSDQGVTFVGALWHDEVENGLAFLDELGSGYEDVVDEASRASIGFGVFGVPETFFIDRDGTVVGKVSGPISSSLLEATLDAILRGETLEPVRSGTVQPAPG